MQRLTSGAVTYGMSLLSPLFTPAKMNTSCRPYLTSPDNGSVVIDLASQMHIPEHTHNTLTVFT
jgi:hypothetical protein